MGVKCDVLIAPSLVFHPDHFKGMVCQLVRRKARGGQVAAKTVLRTLTNLANANGAEKSDSQSPVSRGNTL
jgi:hypothetical protein